MSPHRRAASAVFAAALALGAVPHHDAVPQRGGAAALEWPAAAPVTPVAKTTLRAVRPEPPEARALREQLVRAIGQHERLRSPRVLDALVRVPRHRFVPGAPLEAAYLDRPLPIGHGQTISQPTVVALMTDALGLTGRERVLEIGTGSGYQAAVLSLLAREVYTIERIAPLAREAQARLAAQGYRNVHVRTGDGYLGWPERAPFDRILLTAAPPELPRALVEQLRDGGVLVAPVESGEPGAPQRLRRYTRRGDRLVAEDLGAVWFVPMVPGAESPR